jgi:hypothetical protein
MRKIISFVFSITLLLGSSYAVYFQVFVADRIKGWFLAGAVVLVVVAVVWIWEDFIDPALKTGRSDQAPHA